MTTILSGSDILQQPKKKKERVVLGKDEIGGPLVINQGSNPDKSSSWWTTINESLGKNNYLGGFNKQIAEMLQVPVDVGRETYQLAFGGDASKELPNYDPNDPIGGATAVKDLFESIGINVTPEEDSFASAIGRETAYGAAGYGIIGKAAQSAKYTYGWFEPVLNFVRERPLLAALTELGISVPTGVGAEIGERVAEPFGEQYEHTGEMLGRTVGALSPYGVAKGLSGAASGVARGFRGARTAMGLTKEAQEQGARNIFEAQTAKPETIQRILDEDLDIPQFGRYGTGEVTDDTGLMRLQSTLLSEDAKLAEAGTQLRTQTRRDLLKGLEGLRPETPGSFRFLEDRINQATQNIQSGIDRATANAQAKIDRLASDTPLDTISRIARDEFDIVYKTARQGEKEVWGKVGDGRFITSGIEDRAKSIIDDIPRLSGVKGKPAVPEIIAEIAGKNEIIDNETGKVIQEAVPGILKNIETEKEIAALTSRLNEAARKAYAEGSLNEARLLGELRDDIYDVLIPVRGHSDEWDAAKAFSRRLNQVFYHGPLGQLLGTNVKGGAKVDPSLTLERIVGEGTKGKLGAQSLRDAAQQYGGAEQLDNQIINYLTAKFSNSAMKNGEYVPSSADTFVRKHPVLELYPQLRQQMLDARQAQSLAEGVSISGKARIKSIETQSAAAKFLGTEPQLRLNTIFSGKKIGDLNALLATAKKDNTGDTLRGIKSAMFELLIDKAGKPDEVLGEYFLTAKQLVPLLANKTNRAMLRSIYSEDGLKLLDAVKKGVLLNSRASQTHEKRMKDLDPGSAYTRIMGAVGNLGVIIGAKMGFTHALLAAGIGRRLAQGATKTVANAGRDQTYRILREALEDPKLARELLKPLSQIDTRSGSLGLANYAVLKEMMNAAGISTPMAF